MSKIIVVHSYKGGTGKTSISVNLAATFVKQGKKVAIFDLDFRAPSIFAILNCEKATKWLNDYLDNKCSIEEVLIDLSERIPNAGKLYVGPANPSTTAMRDMAVKDHTWEMRALSRIIALREKLLEKQNFDYIIFDTSPGLQYSSMNALLVADLIIVTTTGDCSDVNGTKRMIEECYNLFETKTGIVLNKVINPPEDTTELEKKIKKEYNIPLLGVVPCRCEVTEAEGKYLFPQDKPNYPITRAIAKMAAKIEKNEIN